MSATNSGVTPAPGFTYSNLFICLLRGMNRRGADGEVLATGGNSVLMDMNTFVWVSRKQILGARATRPPRRSRFANNSLASDATGAVSGGGGFADSYYQPVILGWEKARVGVRAIYGFLAPTGTVRGRGDRQRRLGILDPRAGVGPDALPDEGQANRDLRVPDVRVPYERRKARASSRVRPSTWTTP